MKGAIKGSNWKMASPAKRVAPPIPVRTSEIEQRFVRLRKKIGSQVCPLTFGGFPAKCLMLPIYATVDATVKNGCWHRSRKWIRYGSDAHSAPSTIPIKDHDRMLQAD